MYYVSKYEWLIRSTIFHKAIFCRKTFKIDDEDEKNKAMEQINEFLKGCEHKSACYQTSVNWDVFEIELIIAVDGNIHQQKNKTVYIRDGVDNILGKHTAI